MRTFFLFVASLFFMGQAIAQQSVQGIERPDLQGQEKKQRASVLNSTANATFSFDNIDFWVGDGPNKAAMVISWHDSISGQDDNLVWGYRWMDGDTATGYSMLTKIATTDPRLLALTQLTNLGYTIDGLGYDKAGRDTTNFKLKYILGSKDPFVLGASTDRRISFKFDTVNTILGQKAYPLHPLDTVHAAIAKGIETGLIEHPFNYGNYGYACYDYDYWRVDTARYEDAPTLHWEAGWYDGYWSYFCGQPGSWGYSAWGASNRPLKNGDWDAWSYNADMKTWTGTQPGKDLLPAPAVVNIDKKSATIAKNRSLNLTLTVDESYVDNQDAVWTISSPSAKIIKSSSTSALIQAIQADTIYVKATIGKYSAFCDIIITDANNTIANISSSQVFYSNNELTIKDMSGYTGYIYSIYGQPISTFRIGSDNEMKALNLSSGIYTFTGIKGDNKVAIKFSVK